MKRNEDSMDGRRRLSSGKKRSRIIQTTTRLLLKKGSSSATSTTHICSAARLSRPTLYHYFGSKRGLLLAVHMDHMERTLKPYLSQAAAIGDPAERLWFMVRTYVAEIICKHPELRVLIHDSLAIGDRYFREVRGVWKEHYVLLRDTIRELEAGLGKGRGGIKESRAALFVLGTLTWALYWFDYDRRMDVDRIADEAITFVFRGLGLDASGIDAPHPH